jgi:hypothetical protein
MRSCYNLRICHYNNDIERAYSISDYRSDEALASLIIAGIASIYNPLYNRLIDHNTNYTKIYSHSDSFGVAIGKTTRLNKY